jgi:hypothetical protein
MTSQAQALPSNGHIDVWRADHLDGPMATLNTRDTLDGKT